MSKKGTATFHPAENLFQRMLSPIQLLEHKILRIHFETRTVEGEAEPLIFRHSVAAKKQDEQGGNWLVRLDIQFVPESEGGTVPYLGEVAVFGIFALPTDLPAEHAEATVYMNGGAILFGTARELLSNITSRGVHGPIMLPTVDARSFLPEAPSSTENE